MRDSPLPESLSTFHAVVLAHAKAGVRSGCIRDLAKRICKNRSGFHFRPNSESAQLDSSHLADPTPTKAIWRPLKSHR
jgi:hypothetical protein